MDKSIESTLLDLNRKIEFLQARRDAVIQKEKVRKAKAQDRWKTIFLKEFMKGVVSVYGNSFEEDISPEKLSATLLPFLSSRKGKQKENGEITETMQDGFQNEDENSGDIPPDGRGK